MSLPWVDGYLDGCETDCMECGKTCIGCAGVIKLNEGRVMHGVCYRFFRPTLEEIDHRAAMTCLVCMESCESSEQIVQLALNHAMHIECYDKWVIQEEDAFLRDDLPQLPGRPTAIRPGEEDMSSTKVRILRNQQLFPGFRGPFKQARPTKMPSSQLRPPAGSCNEGASANAEGDDSRPSVGDGGALPLDPA